MVNGGDRIDEQRAEIVADQGHQGLEAAKPGAADHHGLGGGLFHCQTLAHGDGKGIHTQANGKNE